MAKTRAEYYLKKLDLWDKRHMKCMQLSGGMKRRLMIARALVPLVQESRLLILDEPTAGVDIELRHITWDFLKSLNEQGTTIILTTHYLEEAEYLCPNIAIIDEGKIIENTTRDKLLNQVNRETFICDLQSPIHDIPKAGSFPIRLINPYQIEIDINYTQNLNQMFAYLQVLAVEVKSIRPKANRLESLFLNLIKSESSSV
jgi:ABC-2 type transport system ATP-binding protein